MLTVDLEKERSMKALLRLSTQLNKFPSSEPHVEYWEEEGDDEIEIISCCKVSVK